MDRGGRGREAIVQEGVEPGCEREGRGGGDMALKKMDHGSQDKEAGGAGMGGWGGLRKAKPIHEKGWGGFT